MECDAMLVEAEERSEASTDFRRDENADRRLETPVEPRLYAIADHSESRDATVDGQFVVWAQLELGDAYQRQLDLIRQLAV